MVFLHACVFHDCVCVCACCGLSLALAWYAWVVPHDLHDKEGEELVLLRHLLGRDRVAVVVVGEHHQPAVGADQQQRPDTQHVPPDGADKKIYTACH